MERISRKLYAFSSGWVTLVALGVFLLFTALVLPGQAAQADADSGGTGSPDTSFFYTSDDLYGMAEAYGERGRRAYVRARFTFDLVWPLVYVAFLVTSISWTYARAFSPGSRWRWANLMPVLGALFDYLENLSTSLVMLRYPARTAVVAGLAPVFTLVKWIFVNGSFLLLVIGIVAAFWQWVRTRRQGGSGAT